jgi:hypothetical protein
LRSPYADTDDTDTDDNDTDTDDNAGGLPHSPCLPAALVTR